MDAKLKSAWANYVWSKRGFEEWVFGMGTTKRPKKAVKEDGGLAHSQRPREGQYRI